MAKTPDPIPEMFLAFELAYGSDPKYGDFMAFLYGDRTMLGSPQFAHWVDEYLRWKNPEVSAALEDEHLQERRVRQQRGRPI